MCLERQIKSSRVMKAHIKAGAYIPGFMGAKRMKAIDIPLDERPVHRRITPSVIKYPISAWWTETTKIYDRYYHV